MLVTKRHIIRWLIGHRDKVSMKMGGIASDIVARGRRHDNSYTDSTETSLFIRFLMATSDEEKRHNKELLDNLHRNNNDYYPDYFENGIKDMAIPQLLEYIAEKMTEYEESIDESERTKEGYINTVIAPLESQISPDLKDIMVNTTWYIMDSNKYLRTMFEDKANREHDDIEEGERDGEVEEE